MYRFRLRDPAFLPHIGCDVDFSLEDGTGLIITGPNGVGKTSLLQHLFASNRDRYPLALADQKPLDFFYDRSLGEVKEILLKIRTEMVEGALFEELWDEFGLSSRESRRLSALSGGELQSLKLTSCLGRRARLFLLDEPFQALDSQRKQFLAETLDRLKACGASFLVVEHDLKPFSRGWRVNSLAVEKDVLRMGDEWTT